MAFLDERSQARLLDTFLDLVRIDSPSRYEAACADYCRRALESAGCDVRFDDTAASTGSNTGNLIAELPGTLPGVLVLSAHMDCVEPCRGVEPVVDGGTVFSAGPTVLGADDKSGLAAAIECVRVCAASDAPRPTVRCVFTVQEEVGLKGAKTLATDDVAADLCLVLDADGTPGGIVCGAPTHYTFTAEFVGKAAHAGVSPEAGISAMRMAAEAIGKLPIGRLDERTTANVGTINGGTATNVITASVKITGECRSLDRARVEALKSEMDSAMVEAATRGGGEVVVVWTLEYEGFSLDPGSHAIEVVRDACEDAGLEPRLYTTGGGSDANIISSLGVPTVALGCGMTGVHGTGEQIDVVDLMDLCELCVAAVYRLGRREG